MNPSKPKREKKVRERGTGGLFQRGNVWYFSYYQDGVQRIESSHSVKRTPVRVRGKKIRYKYSGLLLYDFRRSAARNLIAVGVPQAVAKKITGHLTDSTFSRYNIVSTEQVHDAMLKVSAAAAEKMKAFGANQ